VEKTYRELKISTDEKEKTITLKIGGGYGDGVQIPFHQVDQVVALLREAEGSMMSERCEPS